MKMLKTVIEQSVNLNRTLKVANRSERLVIF